MEEIEARAFHSFVSLRTGSSLPSSSVFTFEVIDTGVGISPDEQETIFEPFQRTESSESREGSGLGLAIAKGLIELMGGEIGVESPPHPSTLSPQVPRSQHVRWSGHLSGEGAGGEVRKGSRFFFTLPYAKTLSEVTQRGEEAHGQIVRLAEGYTVRALIADDVRENRDVLSKILSDIGCDVLVAENGRQAVEVCLAHRPDVVFLDIRMPVMGGEDAAKQMVATLENQVPKIVAVSASALVHEQQRYREAGFDAFIAKPFRFEQITDCLASLLRVAYTYARPGDDTTSVAPQSAPKLQLPQALLDRLKGAAQLYNVTHLERDLEAVAALGADGEQLASQLRGLVADLDMERLLEVLSEICSDESVNANERK